MRKKFKVEFVRFSFFQERKALRLVEAALNVSEYTDRIDHLRFKSSAQRLHSQLQEICAVLLGNKTCELLVTLY
jgi:hypothetical protein